MKLERPMKTTLGFESLENRRVLSAYTIEILDRQNLVSSSVEQQMRFNADFVMRNMAEFINWKGTLDLRIDVKPNWNLYDGVTPAIMSVTPDGRNATLHEMRTGVDLYPTQPDVGMTVHLGYDGTVKVYGMKAYFDVAPEKYTPALVPEGHFDFVGVLNHEVAHGVGFQFGTTDFSRYVTEAGGYKYFNGPETVRTLGRPLPMSTFGGTHYGNYLLPDNPFTSGLMYQWGNYGGNRLDWGRIDLAVLRDLGLTTKNESRLPLVDTMDFDQPRPVLSQDYVYEDARVGSTVATVSASNGKNYTYQVVEGWGDQTFRFEGNRLVLKTGLDYETKRSEPLRVRMIDAAGVWTVSWTQVLSVMDVVETPVLRVPPWFATVNGSGPLTGASITGDSQTVTVVIFSRSGILESTVPEWVLRTLYVSVVRNTSGGTTVVMSGDTAAVSRNLRNIIYRGSESSLSIQMASKGKNLADVRVPLRHMHMVSPRPVLT